MSNRTISEQQIKSAFAEWMRRYQEDPAQFTEIRTDTPEEYGDGAGNYFIELLDGQQA